MNKKLIALALAALPVAHAMADVTIYGTIEADLESSKTFSNGQVSGNSLKAKTRIDDTGSLIGFKGSEDLGNGLKAIWQVEQGLSIDGTVRNTDKTKDDKTANAYNTFATRDSFVGVQGAFGKVRIGQLSTFLNSDAEAPDAWIYGKGVNGLTYSSMNQLDGRLANAVRYDIPEVVAGLSAAITYGLDESTTNHRANSLAFGASYTNSGYFGTFGYQRFNNNYQTAGGEYKAGNYWRLEAGYNANNLLAAAYFGKSKLGSDTDGTFNSFGATGNELLQKKEAGLTVGYSFGAITPKFSYGRVWGLTADGDKQSGHLDQYVLGADYALSKRTTAYASYGYVKNSYVYNDTTGEKWSNERTIAVGVQHKF